MLPNPQMKYQYLFIHGFKIPHVHTQQMKNMSTNFTASTLTFSHKATDLLLLTHLNLEIFPFSEKSVRGQSSNRKPK